MSPRRNPKLPETGSTMSNDKGHDEPRSRFQLESQLDSRSKCHSSPLLHFSNPVNFSLSGMAIRRTEGYIACHKDHIVLDYTHVNLAVVCCLVKEPAFISAHLLVICTKGKRKGDRTVCGGIVDSKTIELGVESGSLRVIRPRILATTILGLNLQFPIPVQSK